MRYLLTVFTLLMLQTTGISQNMQALHGSPFAGSMATDYNPAGLLNAPYKWDVTIVGAQAKAISNGFYLDKYSLLSSSDTVFLRGRGGYYSRYAHASATVNLFHIRYRINKRNAIAVGGNVRSYLNARTSRLFYSDDNNTLVSLAAQNLSSPTPAASTIHSTWAEAVLSYATVLSSNERGRWQAGVSVNIMRALSGGYANMSNIQFTPATNGDYVFTNGAAKYGYSNNYDRLDSNKSTMTNIKNFMTGMAMRVGLSAGVEYVRYWDEAVRTTDPWPDDYNWKLSLSLMDIGTNRFTYGTYSGSASGVRAGVTASTVQNKFDSLERFRDFRDSLRSIAGSYSDLRGVFNVRNPTRLIVNFDKQFDNDYFINAELQLNLNKVDETLRLNTRELTIAAITPRWETSAWGVYLPIQYTIEGRTWVGLAGKAGPLLIGFHNLANILGKNSFPNAGAYVQLRIYPGNSNGKDKGLNCPPRAY
ncbi:hypothetical protein HNQ91_004836 [Filimonas zeae]|nr:hypothetical protein [Filimonas zeae]MDR6341759.1 hypothetical protein [Filimonas zeae]